MNPFMKLTSLWSRQPMVGEGVGLEREGQPLIGSFALYTAIGSRSQPWKRAPTNSLISLSSLN